MIARSDFWLRLYRDEIERVGLVCRLPDNKADSEPNDRLVIGGAILVKDGTLIKSVKLYRNTTFVSQTVLDRRSPKIAAEYPNHPQSKNSRFVIDYDLVAGGSAQYTLTAELDGKGEMRFATYTSLFRSKHKEKFIPEIELESVNYPDILNEEFWEVARLVWDYTMLNVSRLYNYYGSIRYALQNDIEGDVVECGVALGGSVMMAMEILARHDRSQSKKVVALDTFSGFVADDYSMDVNTIDGARIGKPWKNFYDKSFRNMSSINFDRLVTVQGDVAETLPTLDTKSISVLRLDTDTYKTTKIELEHLYDRVTRNGVVIIDDYGFGIGCRKAVDDFVVDKGVLLQRIDKFSVAWTKP